MGTFIKGETVSSIISHNRYAQDFEVLLLKPFISYLEKKVEDKDHLEILLSNLFRQMECWRYDSSSLPRHSTIFGYDPGVPKEEAEEVYVAMDYAFREVFPAQLRLTSREQMAIFMEGVLMSVNQVALLGLHQHPGNTELLILYMKKLGEAFTSESFVPEEVQG